MNNTNDVMMKSRPNQLTGRIPRPKVAKAKKTTPMKPATHPPGLVISKIRAWTPIVISRNTILGSVTISSASSINEIFMGTKLASAV
jgi:hypothetical protein